MKLYDQHFLRTVRRGVRREVDTRVEWIKIVRRRRWDWLFQFYDVGALRFFIPVLLAVVPMGAGHVRWLCFGAWAILLTICRMLEVQAFNAPEGGSAPFVSMPVSSRQLFDHLVEKVFRASLWLVGDAVAMVIINPLIYKTVAVHWWAAGPAVVLVWASTLSMVSIGLLLLSRRPRWMLIGLFVMGLWAALQLVLGFTLFRVRPGSFIEPSVTSLLWITPPGWATHVAEWLVTPHLRFPWESMALLALAFALTVPIYRALIECYTYWPKQDDAAPPVRRTQAASPSSSPDASWEHGGKPFTETEPSMESALPVEERIRRGTFLQPLAARVSAVHLGWIERLVFAKFPDEAVLLDYMLGEPAGWSWLYVRALWLLVIGAVFARITWPWTHGPQMVVMIVLLSTVVFLTTPVFGGNWPGFYLAALQQRNIAVIAILPVDLRRALTLLWRVNGLRFLLALPCWLGVAAFFAFTPEAPLGGVLRIGAELWLLALLLQPVTITCKYSQGTNDVGRWFIFLGFIFFGLVFLVALTASVVAIFNGGFLWQVGSLTFLLAVNMVFATIYRRLYFGGYFDLLAKRPSTTNPAAVQ